MARLFMAGAEIDGAAGTAPQNTGPDGARTGTVTRDTAVFRSGAASWKCDSAATAAAFVTGPPIAFTDGPSYFLRAYFRVASAPALATYILALGGGAADILARLNPSGAIDLRVAGVAQGSPSASIADGNWHRIELKGTAAATGNWSSAELMVDGVSIATWSGTAVRTNGYSWGQGLQATPPQANYIVNVDDVALNDTTGAANLSWPGDGKVVLLVPVSDLAIAAGYTDSGGATTGLWQSVDNEPPTGIADTTASAGHQVRNAASGSNVNYDAGLTSYTAAGVGASDTVNAVQQVVATGAPVTTSAKQGTFGLVSNPLVSNVALSAVGTAGAFWAGLAAGTYGAGWKWSFGAVQDAPAGLTLGSGPRARITQVTASTRVAMMCFTGAYVDYTPAAAAPAAAQPQPKVVGQAVQAATR